MSRNHPKRVGGTPPAPPRPQPSPYELVAHRLLEPIAAATGLEGDALVKHVAALVTLGQVTAVFLAPQPKQDDAKLLQNRAVTLGGSLWKLQDARLSGEADARKCEMLWVRIGGRAPLIIPGGK